MLSHTHRELIGHKMSAEATVSVGVYHLMEAGDDASLLEEVGRDGLGVAGGGGAGGTGGGFVGGGGGVGGGGTGGVVGGGQTVETDLDKLAALLQEYLYQGGGDYSMEGANYTGGGNGSGRGDLAGVLLQPDNRALSVRAIVAILLGVLGLLANLSSLVAIGRIRNSLTANLRLIVSLCASDMLVSISILLKLTHEAHRHKFGDIEDTCIEHILKALRITSHIISLLNLVGLALDHYFAILKPLNYPTLMCKKHANIMIALFWIGASFCGFSDFILPSAYFSFCKNDDKIKHYCMAVWCSVYTEEYIMFTMAILSSVLMVALYATIFIQIRRYQSFQQQYRQNMKRNRRGLVTTFVIVFTFMVTWLPYCLFDVVVLISNHTNPDANIHYFKMANALQLHFFNLLLLNSFLDPIIYAIRMREVQNGYRNIFPCTKPRPWPGRWSGASQSQTERSRYSTHTSANYTKQTQSESYL